MFKQAAKNKFSNHIHDQNTQKHTHKQSHHIQTHTNKKHTSLKIKCVCVCVLFQTRISYTHIHP